MKICFYCARYPDEKKMKTEPLGIGYLVAYLIQKNVVTEDDIRIVDTVEQAIEFKPDIIAVSSVTQVADDAQAFARECKKYLNCYIFLGGYHISCLPEMLPHKCDIGVLGEGEETIIELINLIQSDKFNTDNLAKVKGICYSENGGITITDSRPLMTDIDSLPFPYRYKVYPMGMSIFTSRGCPYKCIFCASTKFWKGKFRLRSADSVVSEICEIVERFQPERIRIMDDLWMSDKKRFREIVNRLVELKIPERVQFTGFCRSNIVFEEDILLLKKMNFKIVRFGAETGSETLLKRLKGDNISITDHQRVIDLCKKNEIASSGSFMFGIPGETMDDIDATVEFLRKNKGAFHIAGFYLLNPIPGTDIWDDMKRTGLICSDFGFENFQLDLLSKSFSWDNVAYFNDESIPLDKFKQKIEQIKLEFIGQKPKKPSLLKRIIKKLKKSYFSIGKK